MSCCSSCRTDHSPDQFCIHTRLDTPDRSPSKIVTGHCMGWKVLTPSTFADMIARRRRIGLTVRRNLERCPSGRRSSTGNAVADESWLAGSNPALSVLRSQLTPEACSHFCCKPTRLPAVPCPSAKHRKPAKKMQRNPGGINHDADRCCATDRADWNTP